MAIVQGGHQVTLCWFCQNTNRFDCPWFNPDDPQPVPGWVAELRPKCRIGESFLVKECPNFKHQRPQESRAPVAPPPVAPPPVDCPRRGVFKRKSTCRTP